MIVIKMTSMVSDHGDKIPYIKSIGRDDLSWNDILCARRNREMFWWLVCKGGLPVKVNEY